MDYGHNIVDPILHGNGYLLGQLKYINEHPVYLATLIKHYSPQNNYMIILTWYQPSIR